MATLTIITTHHQGQIAREFPTAVGAYSNK